jgi:DNA-binding IclR family transcriptional regulator
MANRRMPTSIRRAGQLVLLTDLLKDGASVAEILRALGISRSTYYRLLSQLPDDVRPSRPRTR